MSENLPNQQGMQKTRVTQILLLLRTVSSTFLQVMFVSSPEGGHASLFFQKLNSDDSSLSEKHKLMEATTLLYAKLGDGRTHSMKVTLG